MQTLLLNGSWECVLPDGKRVRAEVPGCYDAVAGRWDIAQAVVYEKSFHYEGAGAARLCFGGVSYACEVWLNGAYLGSHEGIWDAFDFDATALLKHGENALRLEVTKPGYHSEDRFPLRQVLSGFIPDVLCTFGGIWDDVKLETAEHFFVLGHDASGGCNGDGIACARLRLLQDTRISAWLRVLDDLGAPVCEAREAFQLSAGEAELNFPFQVCNPTLWSTHEPYLYRYELTLSVNGQEELLTRRFGFREVTADGNRLMLNGKPFYLRGILHWGYYDDALIPNPSEETIRAELEKSRAFGFNAVKHCLYIPRQRYFDLMDEYGMLAWVELPLWLPEATPELNPRIRREYPRILSGLRGHPSIGLLSLGCELDASVDAGILEEMYFLAQNSLGALVRDNSGSGECYGGLSVDYADFFDYHFYAELPNMEQLIETFTPAWRTRRPWIFGEFCDSDTLRDLKPIREGKRVERLCWELGDGERNPISLLKPDFYADRHDERMEASGIRAEYALLERLSRAHSLVHRKTTLEQTRSFGMVCGYNVTNLRDVPIAPSGLLDDFGRPKFDPECFRMFNDDLALLPAWDLTRVWMGADRVLSGERYNFGSGGDYALHVLLSNYAQGDVKDAELRYELALDGQILQSGALPCGLMKRGEVTEAGYLRLTLPETDKPILCKLNVSLHKGERLCCNEFPIFVYPALESAPELCCYDPCGDLEGVEECFAVRRLAEGEPIPETTAVLVTTLLNAEAREYLKRGGRVVLVQNGEGALPVIQAPMWREGMMRACAHPIYRELPQLDWQDDLRYFSLTTDVAFDTERLKEEAVAPVLRRYDCRQWTVADYLLEFQCGKGKCVATTLRLGGGMGKAARGVQRNPFAAYLLREMLRALDL